MKKLLLVIAVGCLLMGCRSKIDIANVDTASEVNLSLALPVGSVHATLKDFLGDVSKLYIDSNGVITFKDTLLIPRSYHKVNLTDNVSSSDPIPMGVFDKIAALYPALPPIGGTVPGNGQQVQLPFTLPLKLTGINKSETEERLDSARIDSARFISTISTENFSGMKWEWIDSIIIDLGEQVTNSGTNKVTVYRKGDAGGFDQPIPIMLRDFTLCLMKNRDLNPHTEYYKYANNTVDSCVFGAEIRFTVPTTDYITIAPNSKFKYTMGVEFIDYTAIWGFFSPSKYMRAESTADLGASWKSIGFLQTASMPFSDPEIRVEIETRIAGALMLDSCYIFVEDQNNKRTYANFDGDTIVPRKEFEHYLDPIKSEIGDMSKDMFVNFDKDPKNGHIDYLFRNIPQTLGYRFSVSFNFTNTPQIRMTPDDSIRIRAICRLPMQFNKGVLFNFTDTIPDVKMSQFSIDSLLAGVQVIDTVKTTDVKAIMVAQNTIPLTVKLSMRCLDEQNKVIMDPEDNTKPLSLFENDTTLLPPPAFTQTAGVWHMSDPSETAVIANMTKKKLDVMPKVKKIVYSATVDDSALEEAYKGGLHNISLREDGSLTFKIGLTTQVDAVLNFNKDNK